MSQQLQAADKIERQCSFFFRNGQISFSHKGEMYPFSAITLDVATALRRSLDRNKTFRIAIDIAGITDPKKQLEEFVKLQLISTRRRYFLNVVPLSIPLYS